MCMFPYSLQHPSKTEQRTELSTKITSQTLNPTNLCEALLAEGRLVQARDSSSRPTYGVQSKLLKGVFKRII